MNQRDVRTRADTANKGRTETTDARMADHVRQALAQLGEQRKTLLIETYYRSKGLDEVSTIVDIPLDQVRSELYEALRALRRTLAEQPGSIALNLKDTGCVSTSTGLCHTS